MAGWFEGNHRLLQSLWESLEISSAYHASLVIVSSKFGQLLELGHVFIQLSPLHSEFEEFLLGSFSAHDILEILGEVVNHSVPDPFIHVPSSSVKVSVQLSGNFLDPKVHFGPPKVPKEEHGPGHWVMHNPSLLVDPLVHAPAGHELLHLISISCENFWFLADHFI